MVTEQDRRNLSLSAYQTSLLISLRLRTNYVIRVMRIKDKGDIDKFKIAINR